MATSKDVKKRIAGKRVLVTGGTGSFGKRIARNLVPFNPSEIVVLSRDEDKQYWMKQQYDGKGPFRFMIGDVRNAEKVLEATRGMDIVFHAAAMKQVPSTEYQPFEAILTNVVGAQNVREASIRNRVENVVAVSTDKAVKPVNVMGMTKAIQEKVMLSNNRADDHTRFACVRYGNVLGSRGSVVPLFARQIREKKPVTMTVPHMTRYLLTLQESIDLVFHALVSTQNSELFVRKMPACTVRDLAEVMAHEIGGPDYPIKEIGIRPGEKLHETLVSEEEMFRAVESEHHFEILPFDSERKPHNNGTFKEYTSENTHRMDKDEIKRMLSKEGWLDGTREPHDISDVYAE